LNRFFHQDQLNYRYRRGALYPLPRRHLAVLRTNQPADRGLHPKDREEIPNHIFAIHRLRFETLAAHGETGTGHADQGGEDVVVIPEVLVALPGEEVEAGIARVEVQHLHKLLRFPHRRQAQHQGVDQAEDRRVGAVHLPKAV
jgi:hypothetical protein